MTDISSAPPVVQAPNYQTFWLRVGALFVDVLVLMPITMISVVIMYVTGSIKLPLYMGLGCLGIFARAVYTIVLTARYGQTLGKMVTGVRILRLDGKALSYKEACWRHLPTFGVGILLLILSFICLAGSESVTRIALRKIPAWTRTPSALWFLAQLISVAANSQRRAVHDFLAGTVVVRLDVPQIRRTIVLIMACVSLVALFGWTMSRVNKATHRFRSSVSGEHQGATPDVECRSYWKSLQSFVKFKGRLPNNADEFARSMGEEAETTPVLYIHPATTNAEVVVLWSKHPAPTGERFGINQMGTLVNRVPAIGELPVP